MKFLSCLSQLAPRLSVPCYGVSRCVRILRSDWINCLCSTDSIDDGKITSVLIDPSGCLRHRSMSSGVRSRPRVARREWAERVGRSGVHSGLRLAAGWPDGARGTGPRHRRYAFFLVAVLWLAVVTIFVTVSRMSATGQWFLSKSVSLTAKPGDTGGAVGEERYPKWLTGTGFARSGIACAAFESCPLRTLHGSARRGVLVGNILAAGVSPSSMMVGFAAWTSSGRHSGVIRPSRGHSARSVARCARRPVVAVVV